MVVTAGGSAGGTAAGSVAGGGTTGGGCGCSATGPQIATLIGVPASTMPLTDWPWTRPAWPGGVPPTSREVDVRDARQRGPRLGLGAADDVGHVDLRADADDHGHRGADLRHHRARRRATGSRTAPTRPGLVVSCSPAAEVVGVAAPADLLQRARPPRSAIWFTRSRHHHQRVVGHRQLNRGALLHPLAGRRRPSAVTWFTGSTPSASWRDDLQLRGGEQRGRLVQRLADDVRPAPARSPGPVPTVTLTIVPGATCACGAGSCASALPLSASADDCGTSSYCRFASFSARLRLLRGVADHVGHADQADALADLQVDRGVLRDLGLAGRPLVDHLVLVRRRWTRRRRDRAEGEPAVPQLRGRLLQRHPGQVGHGDQRGRRRRADHPQGQPDRAGQQRDAEHADADEAPDPLGPVGLLGLPVLVGDGRGGRREQRRRAAAADPGRAPPASARCARRRVISGVAWTACPDSARTRSERISAAVW